MTSLYLGKTPEKKYVTYREGVSIYPPRGGCVKKRPSPCGKRRKVRKWDREALVVAVEDYLRNRNLLRPKREVEGSYGSFMAEDVAEALNAAISEVRLAVQRLQQKGEFRFMKSNFPPHDIGRNGYAGGSGWRATIYRYWYSVDARLGYGTGSGFSFREEDGGEFREGTLQDGFSDPVVTVEYHDEGFGTSSGWFDGTEDEGYAGIGLLCRQVPIDSDKGDTPWFSYRSLDGC